MTEEPKDSDKAVDMIEKGAERMDRSRTTLSENPLLGLGMFGMIGWSVTVPTLAGIFLGLWLDRIIPQTFSWTLALLLAGVCVGAVIAGIWVGREGRPK